MTAEIGDLVVKECKASEFADCDIVFSGLDADVAGDIGMRPSITVTLPCLCEILIVRRQSY